MAAAALSVFSLLTGVGSWIAGSPAPSFLPFRGVWIASLAVLGIALVPLWWKLAFGQPDPEKTDPR